jgi:hypothetical protein
MPLLSSALHLSMIFIKNHHTAEGKGGPALCSCGGWISARRRRR